MNNDIAALITQSLVWVSLIYLMARHSLSLAACLISFRALQNYARKLKSVDIESLLKAAGAPPLSILVPVYNASGEGVSCLKHLLQLRYPELDLIMINDGSSDNTLELLKEIFQLHPMSRFPVSELPSRPINAVYQSQIHPRLWVIDKERGGNADALNAGLNFCQTPLFCTTYVTMILERNALLRALRPFLENAATVAVSGIVRVRNGCSLENGEITTVKMPEERLVQLQILEHLRFFLVGYMAGSALRGLLLISGAFAVFRRAMVVEAGGYDARYQAETPELILRLHRFCQEANRPYHIDFIPDPVAWHECPSEMAEVRSQHMKWQKGVTEALLHHRSMLWKKGTGRIGWFLYPLFMLTEIWGPVLEVLGYLLVIAGGILGWVPPLLILAFALAAFVMGSTSATLAVALGELTPRRYSEEDLRQLTRTAWFENLGYQQLRTLWRLQATWKALRKDKKGQVPVSLEF
ncbi:MAG: glycosyltransferase [Candidatus Sericytochromatia bacterium]|nr:glycosyltransferase [Candidatus Sericytochromatia bacterium]